MMKIILIVLICALVIGSCQSNTFIKDNVWCKTDGKFPTPDGGNLYHIVGCLYRYTHIDRSLDCLITINEVGQPLEISCNQ